METILTATVGVLAVIVLVLPPILVVRHFLHPQRLPIRLVFVTCAAVGWLFVNGCTWWRFHSLGTKIASMENPPEKLVSARGADSGPILFALVFGWIPVLVYAGFLYVPGRLIANGIRVAQEMSEPSRGGDSSTRAGAGPEPPQWHPSNRPR